MNKIEVGLQISEADYRSRPEPSYSLFSSIRKHGPQALYGSRDDISDEDGIIIGSIADSLVTEFREPHGLVVIDKKPGGKAIKVIKELGGRMDLVDSSNIVSVKNHEMIKDACTKEDYYSKLDGKAQAKALRKYTKYANAFLKHGNNTLIASKFQYQTAKDIADKIFAKYPFMKNTNNIIGQVKLVAELYGIDIKGMLDFIWVSHKNKTVIPFDLKTGYGTYLHFFDVGYLGWGYYIQASLYKELLKIALSTHPVLHDYEIDNFRFMYCGREDRLPVIYKVTDKQHEAGLNGFTYKGKKYPGVEELVEDYKYYKSRPNNRYRRGFDEVEVDFDDSYLL